MERTHSTLLESNKTEAKQFNERRLDFLKAQNMQLQRQLDLVLDSVQAQQESQMILQSCLRKLSDIVEKAKNDAKAAGSETEGKVTWMMAVPTNLLSEIEQLNLQLEQRQRSSGRELHKALHVETCREGSFLSNSNSAMAINVHGHGYAQGAVKQQTHIDKILTQLDISPVGHLRFDRLLELEGNLAITASTLLQFSRDAMERCFVPLIVDSKTPQPPDLATTVSLGRQFKAGCSPLE